MWPYDAARPLICRDGADAWFWIHAAQAIVFTALALLAFSRLTGVTRPSPRAPVRVGGLPMQSADS